MRTNIKLNTLCAVIKGELPVNTIVGNRKDQFGTFYVAYVATDKDSGAVKWDHEGDKATLNWRKSTRQGG